MLTPTEHNKALTTPTQGYKCMLTLAVTAHWHVAQQLIALSSSSLCNYRLPIQSWTGWSDWPTWFLLRQPSYLEPFPTRPPHVTGMSTSLLLLENCSGHCFSDRYERYCLSVAVSSQRSCDVFFSINSRL